MNYLTRVSRTPVPQSQPLDSRQVKNEAGGYSYPINNWTRLRRFLILGTCEGAFYTNEVDLTKQNLSAVERCIAEDGVHVVNELTDISVHGRAAKQDPTLYTLALCCAAKEQATRQAAYAAVAQVCRTASQLFQFVGFCETVKAGHTWSRGLRSAVANWYQNQSPRNLAYQVTKYQNRDGWSHRDLLRLCHVHDESFGAGALHNYLYNWVTGKFTDWNALRDLEKEGAPEQITGLGAYMSAYHTLQGLADNPTAAAHIIRTHRLPREVVPTELLSSAEVWDALLDDMPLTALIRNLATMTRVGLIAPMKGIADVLGPLQDTERIRASRVHPITILAAMTTYAQGHGVRSQNTWKPDARVLDSLNDAFYASFVNVEPTGQRIMYGLDVSGSMAGTLVNGIPGLDCRRACGALALVGAGSEPYTAYVAFDTDAYLLTISPKQRLDDVVNLLARTGGGGTDCALPIIYAQQHKISVDAFVILSDSETWQGSVHPMQAMADYRKATSIPAKLVVVAMAANGTSIGDYDDAGILQAVGYDASLPSVINEFISGRI